MKFVAMLLLSFIAASLAAPTSISNNNIGDIVNVYVKADLKVINSIDQNIVNVLVALLNQQGVVALPGEIPTPAEA